MEIRSDRVRSRMGPMYCTAKKERRERKERPARDATWRTWRVVLRALCVPLFCIQPEMAELDKNEAAALKKRAGKKAAKKKAKKRVKAKGPSKKEAAEADMARREEVPLFPCDALAGAPKLVWPAEAMRLGFAVKVMGQAGLKSNDTRRWQQNPHLRVSLGHICEIFQYLRKHRIHMYRMSSDLAPYATHPDMPQFHNMVRESDADLRYVGRLAREADIRLSFHPSQFIVLNSENEELTQKSMADLDSQADILDRMGCGPEARLVVNVGGAYGDRESGCARWIKTWPRLGEPVRRRLGRRRPPRRR